MSGATTGTSMLCGNEPARFSGHQGLGQVPPVGDTHLGPLALLVRLRAAQVGDRPFDAEFQVGHVQGDEFRTSEGPGEPEQEEGPVPLASEVRGHGFGGGP